MERIPCVDKDYFTKEKFAKYYGQPAHQSF